MKVADLSSRMAEVSTWKVTLVSLLILITQSTTAEDDSADIDEKLLLTMEHPNTFNGQSLYEGDILEDHARHSSMKALPSKGGLWLERVIPYSFHETVNKSTGDVIRSAMTEWEKKTCLTFVPRTTEKQFLRFRTDGSGCFTFVGKKQYLEGQDVNLGPGCEHLQIAMHEIGHSLGFYHEHSRRDRSSVIKILWQNIEKGLASQFRPGNDNARDVPYDITSIMHYNPMSFSSHLFTKNTMVTLDPRLQTHIGRNRGLTFRDVKLANMIYTCNADCPNKESLHCQNEGYLSPHKKGSKTCSCVCPPNTKGKKCETVTGDYYGAIMCGGEVLKEGIIQTLGYPTRIANESCTWQIKSPVGKRVQVTFEDFSFRPRMDKPGNRYNGFCVYEHVEIRTSNMDEGQFYCDEDIPKGTQLTSTSNTFLILIRADTKGQGRGLKASIKFV